MEITNQEKKANKGIIITSAKINLAMNFNEDFIIDLFCYIKIINLSRIKKFIY